MFMMGTVEKDAETGKYVAVCEECGKRYERSKKESAIWNLEQHMVYMHGAD
jgi:hypothetical protein